METAFGATNRSWSGPTFSRQIVRTVSAVTSRRDTIARSITPPRQVSVLDDEVHQLAATGMDDPGVPSAGQDRHDPVAGHDDLVQLDLADARLHLDLVADLPVDLDDD